MGLNKYLQENVMTLIFINGIDFFPFVCFLFTSCANTILFSLNEEIPSELKGERVGTLEIGFLCNLKNVQLPSIYFDFFLIQPITYQCEFLFEM